jgi:putative Holliday junction resolvase
MRAAGIDFGKVRVGVAVSDELGSLAHPRPHLDGRNLKQLLAALTELRDAEGIEVFVIGLPRTLDGREGPSARRAKNFARVVEERLGVRVELMDEWLSTREAAGKLQASGLDARRARERIDSASAAVVLQAWLDRGTSR